MVAFITSLFGKRKFLEGFHIDKNEHMFYYFVNRHIVQKEKRWAKRMNGYKMEQFLSIYYKDKAKKLHTVIDQIFHRYYGGTGGKDMEEFYGIGTDVLTDIF